MIHSAGLRRALATILFTTVRVSCFTVGGFYAGGAMCWFFIHGRGWFDYVFAYPFLAWAGALCGFFLGVLSSLDPGVDRSGEMP